MPRIILVPVFIVRDGQMEAFLKRMREHRDNCLRLEPGCSQFDIAISDERPNQVLLYEIYDNQQAVTAHLDFPHYKEFKKDTDPLVESVELLTWTLVD